MTKVHINITKVVAASKEAFRESCFLLGRSFTEVISDPGAFPEHSGRDIVDTGALRASQNLQFRSDTEAVFSWPVEYAYYQHEGYTLRNGEEWAGRPWTQEGIQRLNLEDTYNKLLEAKLK
jgi:hypothetical protein